MFNPFHRKSAYALLEKKFIELKDIDFRDAAEYAYVLAVLYQKKGDDVKAKHFGQEAVALLDRCKLRTEWDCVPRNAKIAGVTLPGRVTKQMVLEEIKALRH
jgi:hypothetical protein